MCTRRPCVRIQATQTTSSTRGKSPEEMDLSKKNTSDNRRQLIDKLLKKELTHDEYGERGQPLLEMLL